LKPGRIFPAIKKGASSPAGAERPNNIAAGPPGIVMRTCPAIPAKTLHSPYMSAAQQKAQRVRLG
jgi:hypothetical protein